MITLGIIGVVAAMTIPNLIAKANEKATVVNLKETYSVLQQGFRRAIDEYGEVTTWCDATEDNVTTCTPKLAENLSHFTRMSACAKNCISDSYKNRFPGSKAMGITTNRSVHALNNGISLVFSASNPGSCIATTADSGRTSYFNKCGMIYVDLNGKSYPNIDGRDLFAFAIYSDGIAPLGRKKDTVWVDSFNSNCKTAGASYYFGTCTAYVIENGNMEYLHNPDLTW